MSPRPAIFATSSSLCLEPRGWVFRCQRPGPDWHGHGYTTKTLSILHQGRLVNLEVHKQRWRDTAGGDTVHDRPPRDLCWARYGLVVVFRAIWAWMNAPRGLHHVDWPWEPERPDRRTVQRWLARLLTEALAWQVAIRDVVVDHLAPRPLKEWYPTGLPPPGGLVRWARETVQAGQLSNGLSLLENSAPLMNISRTQLLVEARRRFEARQQH